MIHYKEALEEIRDACTPIPSGTEYVWLGKLKRIARLALERSPSKAPIEQLHKELREAMEYMDKICDINPNVPYSSAARHRVWTALKLLRTTDRKSGGQG